MPEIDLTDIGSVEPSAPVATRSTTPATPQADTSNAEANNTDSTSLADHIIDPTTGELVSLTDVDELVDCFERVNHLDRTVFAVKQRIRQTLADMTEGDTKTRYLRGRRRRVKVVYPSSSWDQSRLKEAWNSYPQHRDSALRISEIGVKLTEFKKMAKESGPADFEQFRNMIAGAEKPSTAPPTITIEE